MMHLKKLALGMGATILTSGLIGGAALAALTPAAHPATTPATAWVPGTAGGGADEPGTPGADRGRAAGLKAVLDKLVKAGTITQSQENAIFAAVKDSAGAKARPDHPKTRPDHPSVKAFVGSVMKTTTAYLVVGPKDLAMQLRAGKSLGEIAGATPGKSRDGLLSALTAAATAKVDAAVTAKKLTPDQAAKLKAELTAHLGRLVDHKAGPRPEHAPKTP